ncbi:unnamed protein product [Rhizoctonia solani]|uniref:G2/mitotic-specific cyclin cdc13 n=1 Tax=Rhizoctonia solani TaxID=456999 RepID=A0A8H3AIP0_9AGAM|nr:unnamed protein product [Rhizoctonia solani]
MDTQNSDSRIDAMADQHLRPISRLTSPPSSATYRDTTTNNLDWQIDLAVHEQIRRYRETSEGFTDPTTLGLHDYSPFLHILLSAFRLEPSDVKSCSKYLGNRLDLLTRLQSAYASNKFIELRSLFSPDDFRPAPVKLYDSIPLSRSANNSNKSNDLKDSFELTYEGDLPQLFKNSLNKNARSIARLSAANRAHNKSISIIQSSGMGKSRLVDETSNLLFTIPINLRETITQGALTYPPADANLRAYFDYSGNISDKVMQAEHAIFLSALFDAVAPLAENFKQDMTAVEQAMKWAEWLKEGQTTMSVGSNRRNLYNDVVIEARERLSKVKTVLIEYNTEPEEIPMDIDALPTALKTRLSEDKTTAMEIDTTLMESNATSMTTGPPMKADNLMKTDAAPMGMKTTVTMARSPIKVLLEPGVLYSLFSALGKSWSRLQKALATDDKGHVNDNMCFVYFDEAHGLTKPPPKVGPLCRMSSYHNLCKVLVELCDKPVFFIFLSTNSNLQQLAPSPYDHPSLRVSQGYGIFPAFTELPFDVFVESAMRKLARDKVSLANVCTADIMSRFGRSMWFAHHRLWLNQQQEEGTPVPVQQRVKHIFLFALDKISAHGIEKKYGASGLAAIGTRVGINFDSSTRSSNLMETKLVESHMRVVYAIPEHREYMRTGSPSEPILAEAAGRRLSELDGKIMEAGPKILAESCQKGFIARGERGELCGRLLLTIAHDLAIPKGLDAQDPNYHRPIPVIDFLCALFAKSHRSTVLGATPINSDPSTSLNDPLALGKRFENAYVSFSHFELARDSNVLGASLLQYSLIRGCAIQAKEGQVSIDAVIPIHMGGVTDMITSSTMSAINVQFKNRKDVKYCTVDRSITVPDVGQPVITIVFELGDESLRPARVHAEKLRDGKPQDASDDLHYLLVSRGHGPETFGVVDARTRPWYDIILGTGDVMDDFPRADEPELVDYVKQMMPLRDEHTTKHLTVLDTPATEYHEEFDD